MTDNKTFIFMLIVLVFFGTVAGILDSYSQQQKTTNYQRALTITTACRLQPNINPDEICGKIPTWKQYK
jgi:hypothetical protein